MRATKSWALIAVVMLAALAQLKANEPAIG